MQGYDHIIMQNMLDKDDDFELYIDIAHKIFKSKLNLFLKYDALQNFCFYCI